MKKVRLNNLYESSLPPEDINVLWADIDENTGNLRAIHKYNKSKGQWEPDMVSIDFMNPGNEDTGEITTTWFSNGDSFVKYILKDQTNKRIYVCLVHNDWTNPATQVLSNVPCVAMGVQETSTRNLAYRMAEAHNPMYSNGNIDELQCFLGGREVNSGVEDYTTQWFLMSKAQYQAFKSSHTEAQVANIGDKFRFIVVYKTIHKLLS